MVYSFEHVVNRLLVPNWESLNPTVPTVTCPPRKFSRSPVVGVLTSPHPTAPRTPPHPTANSPVPPRTLAMPPPHRFQGINVDPIVHEFQWVPFSQGPHSQHPLNKLHRCSVPSSAPAAGWQSILLCPLCTSDGRRCPKRKVKREECYGQVCLQLALVFSHAFDPAHRGIRLSLQALSPPCVPAYTTSLLEKMACS